MSHWYINEKYPKEIQLAFANISQVLSLQEGGSYIELFN